jgi:hypothetical protein
MARRSPTMPTMLHPVALIRVQAFRKGVMRRNAFWRTIAVMIYGRRLLKRLFGNEPKVVDVSTMKGGGHVMEIRTYGPEARRARRRAG